MVCSIIIPIGLILIWYQMILTCSSDLRYRLFVNFFYSSLILYYWHFLCKSFCFYANNFFYNFGCIWITDFYFVSLLSNFFLFIRTNRLGTNYDLISTISDSAYKFCSPAAIPIFTLADTFLLKVIFLIG